jgi:hypothetical protein
VAQDADGEKPGMGEEAHWFTCASACWKVLPVWRR